MTKGEIARFEQFLLLSQTFQKPSATEASICGKELIFQQNNIGSLVQIVVQLQYRLVTDVLPSTISRDWRETVVTKIGIFLPRLITSP